MSSEKTPNLGLHKWAPTDGVLRTEFNDNFGKVDEKVAEVTSQIAGVSSQIAVSATKFNTQPKVNAPLVTVIWDDGWNEDYSLIFPYMKSLGVKGCTALISSFVGVRSEYMNMTKINEMKEYGWDFLSHTVNHLNLANLSYADIEKELRDSKASLIAKGLDIESVVYPLNSYNKDVLEIARKYYKYAFAKDEANNKTFINYAPVNQYAIYRLTLESPLSLNKSVIDAAIANNGWLVLMGHSHYYKESMYPDTSLFPGKWDVNLQNAKDNIEYCIAQGVSIVTAKEAMEIHENSLTIGDDQLSAETFRVSKTGGVQSSSIKKQFPFKQVDGTITVNTPLSAFEKGKVSVHTIMASDAAGFPTTGGVAETYNFGDRAKLGELSFQIWYPSDTTINKYFMRHWDSSITNWGEMREYSTLSAVDKAALQNYFRRASTMITNATLPSALENKKISHSMVKSADNAGFPATAGSVFAVRDDTISEDLTEELFYPYGKDSFYRRRYDRPNGVWFPWREFKPAAPGGVVNVSATWTTLTITFSNLSIPTQTDANYQVLPTVGWNAGSVWIDNITTTGFRMNWATAPTVSSTVGFQLVR
ncbi:polysaccharide deacetylase family protein [Peribacillus simplex]|uniref:polysaccharide deacetylase family protein n=1 Tax=Peribacillus simplex TaxID=1478 RepID=UPI003670D2DC